MREGIFVCSSVCPPASPMALYAAEWWAYSHVGISCSSWVYLNTSLLLLQVGLWTTTCPRYNFTVYDLKRFCCKQIKQQNELRYWVGWKKYIRKLLSSQNLLLHTYIAMHFYDRMSHGKISWMINNGFAMMGGRQRRTNASSWERTKIQKLTIILGGVCAS